MKEAVAQELASRVKNGEIIGIGTGSTVDCAIDKLAERVRSEQLQLRVIPTSLQSAWRCEQAGLTVLHPSYCAEISWGFDGADEVDERCALIKGKGGAMLQEKILAARCKRFVVIVDESKMVARLGERCAVPLEVIPEARSLVERSLAAFSNVKSFEVRQAVKKHGPVITEAGNIIIDLTFSRIEDTTERLLKQIVGVVESGLFIGYADEVLVAGASAVRTLRPS